MNTHVGLAKGAMLAAVAAVCLLAAPQIAAAQDNSARDSNSQPAPYAGGPQRGSDYVQPLPPAAPPPPPGQPQASGYAPASTNRYADPNDQPNYRDPPRPLCRLVEDRAFYPDGTSESRSVQACRGPSGRWHVVD